MKEHEEDSTAENDCDEDGWMTTRGSCLHFQESLLQVFIPKLNTSFHILLDT